jgi:hypothetical protein
MNEREQEIMRELLAFEAYMAAHDCTARARPMDVGGSNGSHHSGTLRRMLAKGWVEDVGYGHSSGGARGTRRTYKYKSTEAGRAALKAATPTREDVSA